MSFDSVSINVRTEVSIDVGWKMSDGRCRSTGDECLRSTVMGEYRSTGLVPGSTVVDKNRATNKRCCRSMRSTLLCGFNAPSLHDLVRIEVEFPYCF
ncbi:hypothetical protein F2Q70_00011602 [Brassica cretica]|uniref:Uncharacterized protein n=1 Tax=Brassica cretica TaxID=69181 RepID=A0A8S9LZF8_BRACR|nr:hypothetical protein F2Q70_00011602 [Brassica cretica]